MRLHHIKPNMTEVTSRVSGPRILFSYDTPVVLYMDANHIFVSSVYHSKTTQSHIKRWMSDNDIDESSISYIDQESLTNMVKDV